MDGYLVLTGNEYGVTPEDEFEFVSLEEAQELYSKYLKENGCAVLYAFTGYSLLKVKSDENF